MNVYIGEPIVVSDMQGPCPDGFHIPLRSEWEGLKTIMSGLGLTTGSNWKINLHMPFAGDRFYSSANTESQNSYGTYWSSSPLDSSHPTMASYFNLDSSAGSYGYARANGYSIRPFKNTYETPDSTWTVITGTLGSAGIFWNQTEGLISITSDGTSGYTIQDKNLGATTVYNNGDTLSESNCGKYYQWGNNYGFAWTGSVTTSSTQVDASNYGPGNYYDSDTFITGNGDWSSVQNDNLRGGVSQGTTTVSQELQNAYIGEYKGWKPGANTVAYFPFKDDATDHSGNGVTLTNSQYLSKQTLGYSWVNSQGISGTYIDLGFTNQNVKFISVWCKINSSSGNTGIGTLYKYGMACYSPSHYDSPSISNKFYLFTNSSYSIGATSDGLTFNEWHHITIGYYGSKVVISKDGIQETLYNGSGYNFGNNIVICGIGSRGDLNTILSECICETECWTADEIQFYYNMTKKDYGL